MKYVSFICIAILLMACGDGKITRIKSTQRSQAAEPIPNPIAHERLVLNDSMAVDSLAEGVLLYFFEKGKGDIPGEISRIEAHYHGMLADGKVFDSSYDKGEAATLSMRSMIPGLKAALLKVPVGSTAKVLVPANQAYGANPPEGSNIPPNAALEFDVELLKIY